jgi:hypothetical protein
LKYKALKYTNTCKQISNYFNKSREKIKYLKKKFIALNFYNEKLIFVTFTNLKIILTRSIKFQQFNLAFKNLLEIQLMKGYLQIFQFKSKLNVKKKENFFYQKFRETILSMKIRKYMISRFSKTFFKNLKYIKKKHIKKQRKYKIMESFYCRKLMIISLSAFTNYRKYTMIKNKYKFLMTKQTLKILNNFKQNRTRFEYIKVKFEISTKKKYVRV